MNDIETQLRAIRPVASPATRQRLDAKADKLVKRNNFYYFLKPITVATTLLIVSVFAYNVYQTTTEPGTGAGEGTPQPTTLLAPEEMKAGSAPGVQAPTTEEQDMVMPSPPIASGNFGGTRRVQRTASLTLGTNSVEDTVSEAIRITDANGGIILSSSVSSSGSSGNGTLDIRVPSENLDTLLARLSQVADVQSRQQNTADVTANYNPIRLQLEEIEAERKSLLNELEQSNSQTRAQLKEELDALTERGSSLEAQRQALTRSVQYASVYLTIDQTHKDSVPSSDDHKKFGPAQAWEWIGRAAQALLGILILLSPLALIIGVSLIWRFVRRRARQKALSRD